MHFLETIQHLVVITSVAQSSRREHGNHKFLLTWRLWRWVIIAVTRRECHARYDQQQEYIEQFSQVIFMFVFIFGGSDL